METKRECLEILRADILAEIEEIEDDMIIPCDCDYDYDTEEFIENDYIYDYMDDETEERYTELLDKLEEIEDELSKLED